MPPPPGTILRRGPGERKRSKDSAGPPSLGEPRPAHCPRPRRAQGAPPARARGTTPPGARTPGSAGEPRRGPPARGRQGDLPSGWGLGSRGGGRTAWGSEGQEREVRPRWTRRRGRPAPQPQARQTWRGPRVHVLRVPLPAHPCGPIPAVCPLSVCRSAHRAPPLSDVTIRSSAHTRRRDRFRGVLVRAIEPARWGGTRAKSGVGQVRKQLPGKATSGPPAHVARLRLFYSGWPRRPGPVAAPRVSARPGGEIKVRFEQAKE